MPKTIFISCGQHTDAEKRLGAKISELVRSLTDCVPFFAEDVQDLNGLDANILKALHHCVGFITVLHPRGEISRPDGSFMRASVWIEQEIAIATYIQQIEKRDLPIIAFKHKSVGREGLRDFVVSNPFEFSDESEVLNELPRRLVAWKSLKPSIAAPTPPTPLLALTFASNRSRTERFHYKVTPSNQNRAMSVGSDRDIFVPCSLISPMFRQTKCRPQRWRSGQELGWNLGGDGYLRHFRGWKSSPTLCI